MKEYVHTTYIYISYKTYWFIRMIKVAYPQNSYSHVKSPILRDPLYFRFNRRLNLTTVNSTNFV